MPSIIGFHLRINHDTQNYNKLFPIQIKVKPNNSLLINNNEENYIENIIHSEYIYILFSSLLFTKNNYILEAIHDYFKLCEKLKYKYILYHLPSNIEQLNNIEQSLCLINEIKKMYSNNIEILLEDTHLNKNLLSSINVKDVYNQYIQICKSFNIKLCLDTAHMFSNSLNEEQMCEILNLAYKESILKVIHLNGNMNTAFKSDVHCCIFGSLNKFNYKPILNCINQFNDIIIIIEQNRPELTINDYIQYFKPYKNLTFNWNENNIDENIVL